MDAATPAPAGALQFDIAEPAAPQAAAGKACAACKTPIQSVYHMANGQVICPGCRIRLEGGGAADEAGLVRFGRAFVYGAGAAVAGTVIYAAVLGLFNLNLALIAILVGYMVGRAVHVGSRKRGGWVYQTLAVGLTYLSIVTSFVPLIVRGMAASPEGAGVPAALRYVGAFFLSIPMPFLVITSDPLTVVIIAFGLLQAWRQTQRPQLVLSGPYQLNRPQPAPSFGAPSVG